MVKIQPTTTDIDALVNERGKTHGDFAEMAEITQQLKDVLRASPNWASAPAFVCEGSDMIVHKLARALCGDWNFKDHWVDVQGYAKRVEERCTK